MSKISVVDSRPDIHDDKRFSLEDEAGVEREIVMRSNLLQSVAYQHQADLLQHVEEKRLVF